MDLRRSKKLKVFPDLSKATNLEELCLEDCCSLKMVPSSIRNLKKLRELDMKRCEKLRCLPTNIDLESLHSLNFSGCIKLRSFPRISRNISHLFLDRTEIKKVPGWIENMSGLSHLSMKGCSNLKHISPNISKLKVLFFSDFNSSAEEYDLALPISPRPTKSESFGVPYSYIDYGLDVECKMDIWLSGGSSRNWKNDVFLSFYGKDVRKTLISHLYKEFSIRKVTTFNDDMLASRDDLAAELAHGIRESRIAIVVLSNNYASSTWCLNELVEIIKCGEEIGQEVIPVYYGVEPAHVRTQILDLGKSFEKEYTVDNYKQQKWIQAFTELNQRKGYYLRDWDSEAEIIQNMADDISFALNITLKASSDVVGAELPPRNLNQETEEALFMQYDVLNWNEKTLFRHIACFLNNETYENVMRLLEDSGLDVGGGLKILFDASLIQISEERVISMHHVLQKIGRDKVLEPFIHQPAKRQLLMDTSEGCDVLIDQTGNGDVVSISFKLSEIETSRRHERVIGMKKLQFVRMFKESLYGKEVRFHLVKGLLFEGMP
ncbi:Toll/interleukin-1 receptor homology (TIR) domain-containing protein [Hirschfeldia incana]|nr:Toll/interleukin-1 receptor homology (TIR) domain-containing protein [Hirschfeldia incana]